MGLTDLMSGHFFPAKLVVKGIFWKRTHEFLENFGQNGQLSHFLNALNDQNDRARRVNDFKH